MSRIADPTQEDVDEALAWTLAKAEKYDVKVEDLQGASFIKMDNVFYCATRPALFLGPLIPNPKADGKSLGLALFQMIKQIRRTFSGDIIYFTRGNPDGIDELAEKAGFTREDDATVMRLRGTHGM